MRVVTVGEIVMDEIHIEGRIVRRQLGGGALYSAVGVLLAGASATVNSVVGTDVPDVEIQALEAVGIDFSATRRLPGRSGVGLALVHQTTGERHQVEQPSGLSMAEADALREPWLGLPPDGVHVAPQTTEGQLRALALALAQGSTVSLDCMVEAYIDVAPYRDGRLLRGTTAFLPSIAEVREIWGSIAVTELWRQLHELAGLRWLVVTRGADGADLVGDGVAIRVPAFPVVPVDTTGAGDAFCGSFLANLLLTGDPVVSAARAAVSAAFVVETAGPLAAVTSFDRRLAERRVNVLLEQCQAPT